MNGVVVKAMVYFLQLTWKSIYLQLIDLRMLVPTLENGGGEWGWGAKNKDLPQTKIISYILVTSILNWENTFFQNKYF